jgi:uncharacterized OB-fold protein
MAMSDHAPGFIVGKCRQCGALYFPQRLICRRCGASDWTEATVSEAVIEEATTVARAIGRADGGASHLASARTPEGLCLVVGLNAPLPRGTRIRLSAREGAPVGSPQGLPQH